jgi:DUF1016 N-terminal domain
VLLNFRGVSRRYLCPGPGDFLLYQRRPPEICERIRHTTFTPPTGTLSSQIPTHWIWMRDPPMRHDTAETDPPGEPFLPLVKEIRELVQNARRVASQNINTLQVVTNFEIGRRIVEHEQKGNRRAGYGERILKELSVRLTEESGRGFSPKKSEVHTSVLYRIS